MLLPVAGTTLSKEWLSKSQVVEQETLTLTKEQNHQLIYCELMSPTQTSSQLLNFASSYPEHLWYTLGFDRISSKSSSEDVCACAHACVRAHTCVDRYAD